MPSEHAPLGPSASERWLACTASVRLSNEVAGYSDSVYAREGTLAHGRAEIEARYALGLMKLRLVGNSKNKHERASSWRSREINKWLTECEAEGLTGEQIDDIAVHAKAYADLLVAKRDAMGPHTQVFLEERVYPGVPQCWGTGDAILVSPTEVEIVDFKYGAGVRVDAEDNPQLKLYGLGALEGYGDVVGDTERVRTTIYQPRVHSEPSSQEWTPADLRAWRRDVVLPKAAEALSEEGVFNPGEVQCRWCPAAGICRPRMDAALSEDFSTDPDIVSDAELGGIMDRLPELKEWIGAVEKVVFRKLFDLGHDVPGWKVVKTEGKRSIRDHAVALKKLAQAGYPEHDTGRTTTKTLGDLEKLVGGKAKLTELLGDIIQKGEGSKALAPHTDPRPGISPNSLAAADFKEEPA